MILYRTVHLCSRRPSVGGQLYVTATPFGSYCPEVFLNSVMSGCVSKLLGQSGCVFLIDASTAPGCEGGVIVHKECSSNARYVATLVNLPNTNIGSCMI